MKLLPFNELLSNFSKQFGTIQLNKSRNQAKTDSWTPQCSAVALADRIAEGFGRRADGFRDGCMVLFNGILKSGFNWDFLYYWL